jgi:regulator of replication initiation timing
MKSVLGENQGNQFGAPSPPPPVALKAVSPPPLEIAQFKSQLNELMGENERLRKELKERDIDTVEMRRQVEEMKRRAGDVEKAHQLTMMEKEHQRDKNAKDEEVRKMIIDLKRDLASRSGNLDELKNKNSELALANDYLTKEVDKLRLENGQMKNRITSLESDNDAKEFHKQYSNLKQLYDLVVQEKEYLLNENDKLRGMAGGAHFLNTVPLDQSRHIQGPPQKLSQALSGQQDQSSYYMNYFMQNNKFPPPPNPMNDPLSAPQSVSAIARSNVILGKLIPFEPNLFRNNMDQAAKLAFQHACLQNRGVLLNDNTFQVSCLTSLFPDQKTGQNMLRIQLAITNKLPFPLARASLSYKGSSCMMLNIDGVISLDAAIWVKPELADEMIPPMGQLLQEVIVELEETVSNGLIQGSLNFQ